MIFYWFIIVIFNAIAALYSYSGGVYVLAMISSAAFGVALAILTYMIAVKRSGGN